jgi:hypothetical protein
MQIGRHVLRSNESKKKGTGGAGSIGQACKSALALFCVALTLGFAGCSQTEKPSTAPTTGQVFTYFGGPFTDGFGQSVSMFDHSTNHLSISRLASNSTAQAPSPIMSGTFAAVPTGFLSVTENFAAGTNGFMSAQNPPLTGAWALEIPGVGALANLLQLNSVGSPLAVSAAPAAMVENTECPEFSKSASFLYVTVPSTSNTLNTANYGRVGITTEGSAVTIRATPFLVGSQAQPVSAVTGGCSQTVFGPVTAYPLNSFALSSNVELIAIGNSGLLMSSFNFLSGHSSPGAFVGGSGVIGISAPSDPIDVSAVVAAQYNGFLYAPYTTSTTTYDLTVLASGYGDDTASSKACSLLQSSIAANQGQGANTVAALPSANSIYGGEFLVTTANGPVNNPTSAPAGSENCDAVIDLGNQDPSSNGLFPNATVFVGANFPPFSATNPWNCLSTSQPCAVSFPAAALVGKIQGQYVIFVVSTAASTPPAQLPSNLSTLVTQPVGIYLFQRAASQ